MTALTKSWRKRKPPVQPDVDLPDFRFMCFYGDQWFRSDTCTRCSPEENWWRLRLVWAAFKQKPAGSLPDDDLQLIRLAQFEGPQHKFLSMRAKVLNGFVKHADGRLYHPVLTQIVIDAFERRIKERDRKARWRGKKASLNTHMDADVLASETGTKTSLIHSAGWDGDSGKDSERDREQDARPASTQPLQMRTQSGSSVCISALRRISRFEHE